MFPGAGKDDYVDVWVLIEGSEGSREFGEEVGRESISMGWAVEVEVEDAGVWSLLDDF